MVQHPALFIGQMVGHAAGLGTGAPVPTAAAHEGAHETLPRIAHTESTVNENFDFHARLVHDFFNFRKRQLPGQHNPLEPQGLHEKGAVQV